jgi:hypothetical protein
LPLSAWQNFYVIVGSAAAALTGLQFVVIALIAGARMRSTGHEIAAFATPTIVHFCSALFISATLSAPWPSLQGARIAIIASGLAGATYAAMVARRARRQTGYKPVLEDWLWHCVLPLAAYTILVIAALMLPHAAIPSLFVTGAMTLLLVFVGIHNAWDAVVYLTVTKLRPPDD